MYGNSEMHHIQKEIILSLSALSPQRFSQLQPPRIPNNTFSYHLKRLVDFGYIEHDVKRGYVPTRKALKLVQFRDAQKTARPSGPAVITILYVTNDIGEVLLLNRAKQPFVDYFGLPSGLIHKGETVEAAAERELKEKTGIEAPGQLTFSGTLDFQYLEQGSGDIFVHAIAFIYRYNHGTSEMPERTTEYGHLSWSGLTRENILPEVQKVHELVQQPATLASVSFDEPV
jgi:ADP-ribose pyrophosphatase YjhB (NUDIX family)